MQYLAHTMRQHEDVGENLSTNISWKIPDGMERLGGETEYRAKRGQRVERVTWHVAKKGVLSAPSKRTIDDDILYAKFDYVRQIILCLLIACNLKKVIKP